MMYKHITSLSNPEIKNLLLLQEKSKIRKNTALAVVEGERELLRANQAGYKITKIFIDIEIPIPYWLEKNTEIITISKNIIEKISYRKSLILGIIEQKNHSLSDITSPDKSLYLIIAGVEKPGNIGAMLRCADAAGVTAVIIADALADIYNPNCVRNSTGALFSIPIAIDSSENIIKWLAQKQIDIYTTSLQSAIPYTEADYNKSIAIVVGTEATGVEKIWEDKADKNIIIPMQGIADSLNVATAAAIVLFEAVRQRKNFS